MGDTQRQRDYRAAKRASAGVTGQRAAGRARVQGAGAGGPYERARADYAAARRESEEATTAAGEATQEHFSAMEATASARASAIGELRDAHLNAAGPHQEELRSLRATLERGREARQAAERELEVAGPHVAQLEEELWARYEREGVPMDQRVARLMADPAYRAAHQASEEAQARWEAAMAPIRSANRRMDALTAEYGRVSEAEREAHPAVAAARAREAALSRAADAAYQRASAAERRLASAQARMERTFQTANRATPGGRVLVDYQSAAAERESARVFGRAPDERTLAAITGARGGDRVDVLDIQDREHAAAVGLKRTSPGGGEASYVIGRTPGGDLTMDVSLVRSGAKTTQSGRDLIDGFRAIRDLGVTRVTAQAAGAGPKAAHPNSNYNGYYTWALMGGTGRIGGEETRNAARAYFHDPSIDRVEQVMDKPGGAAWWKQHGSTFDVTLDLGPGGRARAAVDRYEAALTARAQR